MKLKNVDEAPKPEYPSYEGYRSNRRAFLTKLLTAASAIAVGGALPACGPTQPAGAPPNPGPKGPGVPRRGGKVRKPVDRGGGASKGGTTGTERASGKDGAENGKSWFGKDGGATSPAPDRPPTGGVPPRPIQTRGDVATVRPVDPPGQLVSPRPLKTRGEMVAPRPVTIKGKVAQPKEPRPDLRPLGGPRPPQRTGGVPPKPRLLGVVARPHPTEKPPKVHPPGEGSTETKPPSKTEKLGNWTVETK